MDMFASEDGMRYTKTVEKYKNFQEKCGDINGEVEVMHVPTGFMSINIKVFKSLKDKVPSYQQRDFHTGKISTVYEFFPIRIKNNVLESEDWAFCSLARDTGFKVFLSTNIVTNHSGTYTFRMP
jgi:hypothetical protein